MSSARVQLNALIETFIALDNTVLLATASGDIRVVYSQQSPAGTPDTDFPEHSLDLLRPLIAQTISNGPQVQTILLDHDRYPAHRVEVRTFRLETDDAPTDDTVQVLVAVRPLSSLTEDPAVLRRTIDAFPGLIFRVDDDLRFRGYAGDKSLLVVPSNNIIGASTAAVIDSDIKGHFERHLDYARQHNIVAFQDYTLHIKGSQRSFEARSMWTDDMYLIFVQEIVGKAAIHKHLRQTDTWFKAIADQAEDVIVVHDIEGRILYANQAALNYMGEYNGLPPDANVINYIRMHDESASRYRQHRRRLGDMNTFRYELDFINRADDTVTPAEVHSTMIVIDGEQYVLAMGRDVTARAQTERELRRANHRNRLLLDRTMDAVVMTTYSGRVLETNAAFSQMFGVSAEDVREANVVNFLGNDMLHHTNRQHPDDPHQPVATARFETTFENARGERFEVEVSTYVINIDNMPRIYYFIRDISRERASQRYLQQVALRWQSLYEIDNSIIAAQHFTDIITVVLRHLPPVIRADYACIAVLDNATSTARAYQFNRNTSTDDLLQVPMTQQEVYGIARLRQGQTVHVVDTALLEPTAAERPVVEKFYAYGIHAMLSVPVLNHRELVAILTVASFDQHTAFDDDDISLMRSIATSLAIAYEQTRLKHQLEDYTRNLETKVQDRTAELARLNQRLRELDRMKTSFVTDVSHELRTPVNNLVMRLELLEMDTPDQLPRHRAMLRQQVDYLSDLVEDILQLSRIDISRMNITFKNVDLNKLIEIAINAHRPRAELKGIALNFLPGPLPTLFAEPNQLSQVVTNLLTNALNYTESGSITVETWQSPDDQTTVYLAVTDTGMGVPDDEKQLIFDRFYRGRQVAQSQIPGTGLGLGIISEILSIHSADITVTDNQPQGACFTVRLPILKYDQQAGHP